MKKTKFDGHVFLAISICFICLLFSGLAVWSTIDTFGLPIKTAIKINHVTEINLKTGAFRYTSWAYSEKYDTYSRYEVKKAPSGGL